MNSPVRPPTSAKPTQMAQQPAVTEKNSRPRRPTPSSPPPSIPHGLTSRATTLRVGMKTIGTPETAMPAAQSRAVHTQLSVFGKASSSIGGGGDVGGRRK